MKHDSYAKQPTGGRPGRREQQVIETKEKLCRAALETISELGYHASTTPLIAKRAGVSRGAQTHHYPTKLELVVAAFSFLVGSWEVKRIAWIDASRPDVRVNDYLDFLWGEIYNDTYYIATLEMLLAAKGDERLKSALTAELEKHSDVRLQIWRELICGPLKKHQADALMHMTICLFRGMSLQSSLNSNADAENARSIEIWKDFLTSKVVKSEPAAV